MKKIIFVSTLIFANFLLGCKSKLPPSISPSDVKLLSKYITLDKNAVKKTGDLPAPNNLFTISTITSSVVSSNGSTVSIVIRLGNNAVNNIAGYYINIDGSDVYFKVPIGSISSNGLITIPIGLPTVLEAGKFCVNLMTYNSENKTSNIVQQCIDVVKLGSGSLQINLAWDTDNTDIDLHVIDPSGYEIYYSDDYSPATGGRLDRDDIDGFGPENIYWNDKAPDGEYKVYIHYYGAGSFSSSSTNTFITVNGIKDSQSYTKNLTRVGQYEFITRIKKSGDKLTFLNTPLRKSDSLTIKKYPVKK